MERKETEITNRPSKLLKAYIKDDEQLLAENEKKNADSENNLSQKLFGKQHEDIQTADLRNFTEEVICSLYVLRKNIPFNFIDVLKLLLNHPEIDVIDRNVV